MLEGRENGAAVPLSYQLYVAIKRDILTCELAPGAAITERWICKKHNASRTPIREACLWLARDGLLESIPNKGYAVSNLSLQDLNELFQLRSVLEVAAVELAIRAVPDPALLAQAEEICGISYEAGDRQGYFRWLEANHEFHQLIARMGRNRRLVDELDRVNAHFIRLFYMTMPPNSAAPTFSKEHLALLDVIRKGDVEAARQGMADHIQHSKERAIRYFLA
jgi:DNA-binding GntR family transcriptional regulator